MERPDTIAMARHAAVDLALIFKTPPRAPADDRLPDVQRMRESLRAAGLVLHEGPALEARLTELRGMYEPFLAAFARRFLFALPPILPTGSSVDNWQRSAWMRWTPGIGSLPAPRDDHFA